VKKPAKKGVNVWASQVSRIILFGTSRLDGRPSTFKSWKNGNGLSRAAAFAASTRIDGPWWIVECHDANEGRAFISGQYEDDQPGYLAYCARHILASGGRKP